MNLPENGDWPIFTHLDLLSSVFYQRSCKVKGLWLTLFLMFLWGSAYIRITWALLHALRFSQSAAGWPSVVFKGSELPSWTLLPKMPSQDQQYYYPPPSPTTWLEIRNLRPCPSPSVESICSLTKPPGNSFAYPV